MLSGSTQTVSEWISVKLVDDGPVDIYRHVVVCDWLRWHKVYPTYVHVHLFGLGFRDFVCNAYFTTNYFNDIRLKFLKFMQGSIMSEFPRVFDLRYILQSRIPARQLIVSSHNWEWCSLGHKVRSTSSSLMMSATMYRFTELQANSMWVSPTMVRGVCPSTWISLSDVFLIEVYIYIYTLISALVSRVIQRGVLHKKPWIAGTNKFTRSMWNGGL